MSKHNLIQLHFALLRDLLYTTQLPGHTSYVSDNVSAVCREKESTVILYLSIYCLCLNIRTIPHDVNYLSITKYIRFLTAIVYSSYFPLSVKFYIVYCKY